MSHTPREQVTVQVEALEFDGVEVREPARVQAAFQAELARLLTEQGVPEGLDQGQAGTTLDGGALETADLARPETLGEAVARLVYAGMGS